MEGASKITIRIFKSVTLVHEGGMVLLEVGWKSSLMTGSARGGFSWVKTQAKCRLPDWLRCFSRTSERLCSLASLLLTC